MNLLDLSDAGRLNFLADAAIKSFLLMAAALALLFMLRRASAAMRHHIGLLSLVCLLVSPCLGLILPAFNEAVISAEIPVAERPLPVPGIVVTNAAGTATPLEPGNTVSQPAAVAPATKEAAKPPSSREPSWLEYGLMLWLIGVVMVSFSYLWGLLRVVKLKQEATELNDAPWQDLLTQLKNQLLLSAKVKLLKSEHAYIPVTWGSLRPAILLPSDADEWSEERRRMVLLHELSHIKRLDFLGNAAARLCCALYWFNPLVWMMNSILREEREQACDNLVLSRGFAQTTYAEHLFEIACRLTARGQESGVAMAAKSKLEERVRFITAPDKDRNPMTPVIALTCITSFALLTLGAGGLRTLEAKEVRKPMAKSAKAKLPVAKNSGSKAVSTEYGFVMGRRYVYDVRIQFGVGQDKSVRQGQVSYVTTKADDEEFTLRQEGDLQLMNSWPGMFRGNPFLRFGASRVSTRYTRGGVALERNGDDGERSIIGDLPSLIVAPLENQRSWQSGNELEVKYTAEVAGRGPLGRPPGFPFEQPTVRRLKARQNSQFNLETRADGQRILTESYQLSTLEKSGSHPLYAADYEGIATHSAAGIPQSLELKGNLHAARNGQSESTPFSITYRLLSGQEVKRRAESNQEFARQSELGREIGRQSQVSDPQPMTDSELVQALELLASDSTDELVEGLTMVGRALPQVAQKKQVLAALKARMNDSRARGLQHRIISLHTRWFKAQQAEAVGKAKAKLRQATAEEVAALIQQAGSESNLLKRNEAIASLGKTGSRTAAKTLADLLANAGARRAAAGALGELGSIAAPEVARQLEGDLFTRVEALKLLRVIGTTNELGAVRAGLEASSASVRRLAAEAVDAIEERGL